MYTSFIFEVSSFWSLEDDPKVSSMTAYKIPEETTVMIPHKDIKEAKGLTILLL